jgi:hypothetical protein
MSMMSVIDLSRLYQDSNVYDVCDRFIQIVPRFECLWCFLMYLSRLSVPRLVCLWCLWCTYTRLFRYSTHTVHQCLYSVISVIYTPWSFVFLNISICEDYKYLGKLYLYVEIVIVYGSYLTFLFLCSLYLYGFICGGCTVSLPSFDM